MISVVIPVFRPLYVLGECLRSLQNQTLSASEFEVILVSERTLSSLVPTSKVSIKTIELSYGRNISLARNTAARTASGDILAFLDEDCVVSSHWLEYAKQSFAQNNHLGAVGGPAVPWENDDFRHTVGGFIFSSPLAAGVASKRYRPAQATKHDGEKNLLAANTFMRTKAFQDIGGFNQVQSFAAEEKELYMRLQAAGWKLAYDPRLQTRHRAKPILLPLLKTIFTYAEGYGRLVRRTAPAIRWYYLLPSIALLIVIALGLAAYFSPAARLMLYVLVSVYAVWQALHLLYMIGRHPTQLLAASTAVLLTPLAHGAYAVGVLAGIFKY